MVIVETVVAEAVRVRGTAATLFPPTCTFLSLYNYTTEQTGCNKGFEFFQEHWHRLLTNNLHYCYCKREHHRLSAACSYSDLYTCRFGSPSTAFDRLTSDCFRHGHTYPNRDHSRVGFGLYTFCVK